MSNGEQAIRSYLEWVAAGQPPVRDEERIADLERRVAETEDVLEKLRLLSELERAAGSDHAEQLRQGFVEHAKAWAEDNQVSAEAFRRLGVPDRDLRDAGIRGARERRRHGARRTAGRTRVSRENIVAAIPHGRFTKAQVAQASGASPGAVNAAVAELVDAGEVKLIGPDPDHRSRGRAPLLYERLG